VNDRLAGCLVLILGLAVTLVIVGGILAIRMNGTGASIGSSRAAPDTEREPGSTTITYQVTGTVPEAEVTYQDARAETRQAIIRLPWQQSFAMGRGAYAHLAARSAAGPGSLTCRILVDGADWRTASSSDVASCGGFVGTQ
jgi:Mycobacterium membrane protein